MCGLEYLAMYIAYMNVFLNINKGIPEHIIKQLGYIIYQRYNYFTLADLKLLFDHILESRYGTFYGSIDTQRIISSFYEYANERKAALIKLREAEVNRMKEEEQKRRKEYTTQNLDVINRIMENLNINVK